MKKLLAALGLLVISTPAAFSFVTLDTNKTNISEQQTQLTIDEQIIAGIKENALKIPSDSLLVNEALPVNEFREQVNQVIPQLMRILVPEDLANQFNFELVKINNVTLDGQELTDKILSTEGHKVADFNFDYATVKNEVLTLTLNFDFK